MTAAQESTHRTKTQAFKVKLKHSPLNRWMDALVTDRMPIATGLTCVTSVTVLQYKAEFLNKAYEK
jgi:hypothetical protein